MTNMDNLKLTPAIKTSTNMENSTEQLSPREFQTTLYYWFNQKGLVSNMRSYLRMKMINELKKTTLGDAACKVKKEISMENQALNVLIADFLYQHRYDYSLSVFSTEIPIKNLVSEFCFFMFNDKERYKRRYKMNEDNVMCILESIGLSSNNRICREIISSYRANENVTLLICILKIVINYNKSDRSVSDSVPNDEIGKIIKKNLMNYELPSSIICYIIEKVNTAISQRVNANITKVTAQHQEDFGKLKREFEIKEREFKQVMLEKEKEIYEQRRRTDKEHKKIVALTENMIMNEKRLAEKSVELDHKLKKVNDIEMKLTNELKNQSKAVSKCNLKHCDKRCQENEETIEALKLQKKGFEKIAENQNTLITNLTSKSTVMYNELQDALTTISNLKRQLNRFQENELIAKNASELVTETESGLLHPSDEDMAEEIIKQSQYRLQQLEKEGEEIDKKFKQFQLSFRHS